MSPQGEQEILLVEDSQDDVALTLRALGRHKLSGKVHVVRDGAEAIEYLQGDHLPRLILLDLKLPKVSGLDVLRRVKSDWRTRTIPVVVLTSSREGPDIEEAYRLGANSYIVKPVDFEQFIEAVSDAGLYWLVVNQPPRAP